MALIPSPAWLDTGNNAWQMTSATLVGLMSVPGLAVLYGGAVKKKWAINSAFMVFYAFAAVLIVWLLWAYNMSFGPHWLHVGKDYFLGTPHPTASAADLEKQAIIPDAAAGMPPLTFPMSTMVYFQFVFAAITVIILAGAILGRVSFKAWMIFVPLWMTFVYTVGAFSLWGGGWLGQLGVVDYSGGYVIHLTAAASGYTAAAVIGPRLARDRESFHPNSLLITLIGAGLLWLGWNGFNGGDPYFANMDSSAAVLNTNVATAAALLTWLAMDVMAFSLPSVLGAVNGMICGLVAITPAAGYINGFEAIILGIVAAFLPWLTWNKLGKMGFMRKVDDTLGVIHTHGVAALVGGIGTGILANPHMIEYMATGKDTAVSVTGWLYGNFHQVLLQIYGAAFIIVINVIGTFILLKLIGLVVPLRMDEEMLKMGDEAAHGEEAYAIYADGQKVPVMGD
ncbi:ammonium transporter [Acidiphilium acidophilum]|jgi:ammonium transporter|uniref:Ammonium transporter n=1 Tax=Acidiphilium acidophilum TaxID=76588 RepID=A0AAW9DNB9_ACIAO|nr:ammonium transporter [Acidiphilium acidophilum]MDX5930538.1 ammonium transporter [Acidiphilium acidophilum]MEE3501141.1 ammonium transporter [Acidiphilium acidophilum]